MVIPIEKRSAKALVDLIVNATEGITADGQGTGYVIAGGGRYARYAYATCRWIREHLKDESPIEVFSGSNEAPNNFGIKAVRNVTANVPGGYALKARAVMASSLQHVFMLDSDSLPMLTAQQMQDASPSGAMFFPDVGNHRKDDWVYVALGIPIACVPEMEAGQLFIDRVSHARAVALVDCFNQKPEFFYHHLHGDKDLWALAFARLGIGFDQGQPCTDEGWGLRHYLPDGTHASDHLIRVKAGRQYSDEVNAYLEEYDRRFVAA